MNKNNYPDSGNSSPMFSEAPMDIGVRSPSDIGTEFIPRWTIGGLRYALGINSSPTRSLSRPDERESGLSRLGRDSAVAPRSRSAFIINNSEFAIGNPQSAFDIGHFAFCFFKFALGTVTPPPPRNPDEIRATGQSSSPQRHKGHKEIICAICGFFTSIHSNSHIILTLRKEIINNLNPSLRMVGSHHLLTTGSCL